LWVIKPLGEDSTPATVKPLPVSLVEPVAYRFSYRRACLCNSFVAVWRGRSLIQPSPKSLLEKVGPVGLQVTEQFAKDESAVGSTKFLFAFHTARFFPADVVESLVHLRHVLEAVQDVHSVRALLANDFQIGCHMSEQTKAIVEANSSPIT